MAKKTTSENEPDADEISKVMAHFGAKGGANSRANLSAAKRTDLAKRAAKARWGTKRKAAANPAMARPPK